MIVMCLDFDSEGGKGVCGSPLQTLEVFKLSQQVRMVDCSVLCNDTTHLQDQLEKHYSIHLRNSGVADVQVRHDHKIIASGGWDGR